MKSITLRDCLYIRLYSSLYNHLMVRIINRFGDWSHTPLNDNLWVRTWNRLDRLNRRLNKR